ncbi:MAG: hypothetical protein ACQCN5_07500 [Candidatus Bathyarchaeia archaeon]|jgi:uncharacterized protein (DUF486 family)
MSNTAPLLLVGDNPFHGISHLSQTNVKNRGKSIADPKYASNIVAKSIENGANGFMFSVSETTLGILRSIPEQNRLEPLKLYPIVPYAYEYVRIATHAGGVTGLAKRFASQLVLSGNLSAGFNGLKGVLTSDVLNILDAYVSYELSRVKSASKNRGKLQSLLLHEIVTEMAISLNLPELVYSYIKNLEKRNIQPGFETRNFPYLVNKFTEWGIDLSKICVSIPVNKIGFYMNPSREATEKALETFKGDVIAMSILAAGYLKLDEATDYIRNVKNVAGVVVGVSNERQATETFKVLSAKMGNHKKP